MSAKTRLPAFLDRLVALDRRIVFALVAVVLALAVALPPRMPAGKASPEVSRVYQAVESLPENSFVLICADIDPANAPELYPQALAVARHAFRKNLRVAVMYFGASAAGTAQQLLEQVGREYPARKYGTDYVLLPYMPDIPATLTQMGNDIYALYGKDSRGASLRSLPVMSGVSRLGDVNLAVVFCATTLLDSWVALASDRYGFRLAGGVTAVIEPRYGPYLQTGQLAGLISGLRGGAEYEGLLGEPGAAAAGLDALNVTNLLALLLVLAANAAVWLRRLL
ncbi:MAG: hypothetical protein GX410_09030 [Elusimicrobia bacterium]|nr:hypothetical protein [Elusimicrobiota bacterium]